jgi:hypothetical protein
MRPRLLLTLAWLAGLYFAGILLWGLFFNWGRFPLNFHDWASVTAPRLNFLNTAINRGVLPLHDSNLLVLSNITDRFLSIPDQILSPQIVFLRFLPVAQFAFFDTILLYSIGFFGLVWFQRKFKLSPVAFLILFALFNFNGNILAHLSVGHLSWEGYFLFPWFAALVIRLIEGVRGWRWIAKTSILLFVIFLQGSYHQYVWLLLFLAILAVVRRDYLLTVAGAGVAAVLLSLVRILPAALVANRFDQTFFGGFPTVVQLWESLITIYPPGVKAAAQGMPSRLGYWEFSMFTGLVGAGFLIFFGIYRWLSDPRPEAYRELLLPVTAMIVMSVGWVYAIVRLIPIPLLTGERVTSRILSLSFVFILILAVIEFQRWLDQPHAHVWLVYILSLALAALGLHDLGQNFNAWMLVHAASEFPRDPILRGDLLNIPDRLYVIVIGLGAVLSLASLGVLLTLAWLQPKFPRLVGRKGGKLGFRLSYE